MTALGFFLLATLFLGGSVLCVWLGYLAVASCRSCVSPGQGFQLGAADGLMLGIALLVLFNLFSSQAVQANPFFTNWRTALVIWLILPLCGGLFGGLGGQLAVQDRLRPWNKRAVCITPKYFGPGSQHSFNWYLQRNSAVAVRSIGEICRWLHACEYMTDLDQFRTIDYWQHPVEFECTRRGDCEDHALWAWRKLIELGYAAEFMVGTSYRNNPAGEYHAWVVFIRKDRRYLLESAYKHAQMIAPLAEAQRFYDPDYGIDQRLQTYSYRAVRKRAGL